MKSEARNPKSEVSPLNTRTDAKGEKTKEHHAEMQNLWAVLLTLEDGRKSFAIGDPAGVRLFYRWREANQFRKELMPHLRKTTTGKVVRVVAEVATW